MKKILKLSLGIIFALTLFFGNVTAGPMTGQNAAEVEAATIKLNKKKLTLYVKKTATLKVSGTKKKAKWSSSNKKIAKVDKKGKVTALKKGTATITAKIGKKKYTCKVTVKNPTISKTSATVYVGKTSTLTVSNAVGTVTWTSSSKAIATVSTKGVVKGVKAGTATITAKASGVKLTCKVTVKNRVAVTKVTLNKSNATVFVGKTLGLTATVAPSNATFKTVTWTSSNKAVATVSADGQVKGVSVGTADITATADGVKAVCKVSVEISATGITLDDSKYSEPFYVGDKVTLSATLAPANTTNKKIIWKSSNENIASVDQNGVVTALKNGYTSISASSASNPTVSAETTIHVSKPYVPVESVSLDKTTASVAINDNIVLSTRFVPADASIQTVTWKSDKPEVARVDTNGRVYGLTLGTATITVTTTDGKKTASATITVIPEPIRVTGVTLNKSSVSLLVNETSSLTATVQPSNATYKDVTWSTSNSRIAKVDQNGTITGIAAGTATITVTTKDQGKTASATVTVSPRVTGVTLDKETATINVGGSATLNATVLPANAGNKKVTWSSDKTNVARVDQTGKITGVGAGTATITVTTEDQGKTASAVITVVKAVEGISLNTSSFDLDVDGTYTLTATITPSDATNKKVIWSSSNESVATVDQTGKVKGISIDPDTKKGVATITATAEDTGVSVSATVTVTQPVTDISIVNRPGTLYIGDTFNIRASAFPKSALNSSLKYTSADENIATVSESGKITPVNVGTTRITVSSVSYPSVSKEIEVTVGFDEETYFKITDITMNGLVKFSAYDDILTIYGNTASLPEIRSVETFYKGINTNVRNSDVGAYEKMVVATYGEYSKTYYIEYHQVTAFNDDIYALGEIDQLNVGQTVTADLSAVVSDAQVIYSFKPSANGTYKFSSSYVNAGDDYDIAGTLYGPDKNFITQCDEGGNFEITEQLEANKTYYIALYTDGSNVQVNVTAASINSTKSEAENELDTSVETLPEYTEEPISDEEETVIDSTEEAETAEEICMEETEAEEVTTEVITEEESTVEETEAVETSEEIVDEEPVTIDESSDIAE